MEYLNVRNGSFIGSGSNLGATNRRLPVPENLYKSFAIFSKMEMQLSPFLLCNFRYFYFTTNKVASLESKKAKADAKAAEEAKKTEAEAMLKKLLASGMSADEILEKLK